MPEYIKEKAEKLNKTEKRFVCFAINNFGEEEGGPYATPQSLPYFAIDFAKSCIREYMYSGGVTGTGLSIAGSALSVLGG